HRLAVLSAVRAAARRRHGVGGRVRKSMEKLALLGGTPLRSTLLPYARQTIDAADVAAVTAALTGDWITQGPTVARFEEALAAHAGAAYAVEIGRASCRERV